MKNSVFMLLTNSFLFFVLTFFLSGSEPSAAQATETKGAITSESQALSGHGENFEIVLKYFTFKPGNDISLVAYVLDKATNEPIKGATLSGSLSNGNESASVVFKETPKQLPGAYDGKVRVLTDKPYSWLFDVSLGEKSDLVAIDGFKAGEDSKSPPDQAVPENKETAYGIILTPVRIVLLIVVFIGFQAAVIYFVRRRFAHSMPGKELK